MAVRGIGVTDLKTRVGRGPQDKAYLVWQGMMNRCYSEKVQAKGPTYKGCWVCDEWHTYSTFKKWFETRYFEGSELDKDLRVCGNKEYSPRTCAMIPSELNMLFCNSTTSRRGGFNYGVKKSNSRYTSIIKIRGKVMRTGTFDTPEEAVEAWRVAKRRHVQEVADECLAKGRIDRKLYRAVLCREIA